MNKFPNTQLSLFYVFINKKEEALSDEEVLSKLGLNQFQFKDSLFNIGDAIWDYESLIYITECKSWMHIIDGSFGELWNFSEMYPNHIQELGKKYELYACMAGDTTEDLIFYYYKDGSLNRKHIYEEDLGGKIIHEEYEGYKLMGENFTGNPLDFILNLAISLGIDINHDPKKIRCYSHPNGTTWLNKLRHNFIL